MCRMHAASVLHMSANLVRCQDGLIDMHLANDALELSIYLAAISHDFQHPGEPCLVCHEVMSHHLAHTHRHLYEARDMHTGTMRDQI